MSGAPALSAAEDGGITFPIPVAEIATSRVPVAAPDEGVGELRRRVIGGSFDEAGQIVVLDQGRLAGLLAIERLLDAPPEARVREVMDADPPVLAPGRSQEAAAWEMVRHGQSTAAVVDAEGGFVGMIPSHRLIGQLLAGHDEDMARLGGYLASSSRARLAAEEPVSRRLLHRLPWLAVGLAGAMASALIVGAFEAQLDKKVLLAFFVPAVVYMADAVGTQTEIVLIRGFSAGIHVPRVVRQEILTGLFIGLLVGAVFFPFALIGWGDEQVALAVALALFASCAIATTVATVLPRILQRAGTDPAFGSGPLATIVQDLLSIAVYLAIATPLAT